MTSWKGKGEADMSIICREKLSQSLCWFLRLSGMGGTWTPVRMPFINTNASQQRGEEVSPTLAKQAEAGVAFWSWETPEYCLQEESGVVENEILQSHLYISIFAGQWHRLPFYIWRVLQSLSPFFHVFFFFASRRSLWQSPAWLYTYSVFDPMAFQADTTTLSNSKTTSETFAFALLYLCRSTKKKSYFSCSWYLRKVWLYF